MTKNRLNFHTTKIVFFFSYKKLFIVQRHVNMLKYDEIIEDIRDNGGFESNNKEDSYYRVYTTQEYKPIQVRISNHGTRLWTWIGRKYDPSRAINICIVFSQDGEFNSNTTVDMSLKYKNENGELKIFGQRNSFEVIQYCYNCQLLDIFDAREINKAIHSVCKNKCFQDPLKNTPKQAKVYRLTPNNQIEIITENKEIKTNENMAKNKIRITENELKQIVTESIKKVLNEGRVDSNFITYTQSIRDKVQEYLKPVEEKLGDNIGSEVCNAGHNFIKELNLFIDECYRQEAYKY